MLKRAIDVIGGWAALVLFALPMLLIAIAIRVDSKGPVFFCQDRLGLRMQPFRMIKFRSMVDNAEHLGTGLFSYVGDPRITRAGHFLRKTSLDELPQIFNVLRGEMSLVGPRPPVTYELGPLEDYTYDMKQRFEVKPGITGLAQVSGRNNLTWPEKLVYDIRYVKMFRQKGIVLDISILCQTVWVVLTGRDTVEKKCANIEDTK
jgi:lipopolysaccharide/colanic/teichoic acid biosynthesis glycosyltransferase